MWDGIAEFVQGLENLENLENALFFKQNQGNLEKLGNC